MENNFNTPAQVHENMTQAAVTKAGYPLPKLIMLGIMAGICIAMGAEASNVAMHNIANVGVARLVAGCVFPVGLMTLVLLGGELFTGNTMMLMGLADKRVKVTGVLRNWVIVFFTNMIGSVFLAYLVSQTGQWDYTDGMLGALTIKIAVGKVSLSPWTAFCSGIMCNVFVCAAVLMASAAKDITGKLFACFFPICAFVISGFEHCVANMYYIPAGMMAAQNEAYVTKAQELYGISAQALEKLNLSLFFYNNLVYVTLGNIIGGGVVIGLAYYMIFVRKGKNSTAA